ncbi:hypothetical protein BofuT4_uP143600.1 [Botrytis cinerea T4]|uniref:Uncharacterized protein n=1 Tax=Botryotinia fuckeliana (strain T4) TaxID=999810 RepID=G2YY54_BOTF4|nr:hypothetical protein BofuT4_uP143600.1 [Botrytis cinerea T4]
MNEIQAVNTKKYSTVHIQILILILMRASFPRSIDPGTFLAHSLLIDRAIPDIREVAAAVALDNVQSNSVRRCQRLVCLGAREQR